MTERTGNKAPDWGIDYGIRELWSEITPGLWVGGTGDADTVGDARRFIPGLGANLADAEITKDEFDAVVTLYAWAQPVDWEVEELRWGIYDDPTGGFDEKKLYSAIDWAYDRWQAGERVLVRCQAGLNRSSLVVALILVKAGHSPQEAIQLIRSKRSPRALFNEGFVNFILRS